MAMLNSQRVYNSEMSMEVVTLTRLNFDCRRDADGRKVGTITCPQVKTDQPSGDISSGNASRPSGSTKEIPHNQSYSNFI